MQTMGYVMGDDGVEGEEGVEGYVMGDDAPAVVGRGLRLPRVPRWRKRLASPGVPMPGEGLEVLPLNPDSFGGVFDSTNNGAIITWLARPQRPFRAERLLVTVRRFGTPLPQQVTLCDGIFVGTTLSQVTRGAFDLENFAPNAFGVRMQLVPAEPGVDITLPVRLFGPALAGGEGAQSIIVSMMFMGRTIQ